MTLRLCGAADAAADPVGTWSAGVRVYGRRVDRRSRRGSDPAGLWRTLFTRSCQSDPARVWLEPPEATARATQRDEAKIAAWAESAGCVQKRPTKRERPSSGQRVWLLSPAPRGPDVAPKDRPRSCACPSPVTISPPSAPSRWRDASSSRCAKTATTGRRSSGSCVCSYARSPGSSLVIWTARRFTMVRQSKTFSARAPSACSWSASPATRQISTRMRHLERFKRSKPQMSAPPTWLTCVTACGALLSACVISPI